ncbi:MAG: TonB-dependent receptor, partial [Candidatus Eremiobacteraeota bacterium]|nr:TonB-dependent receptor [Candidatus Eremiobacteraeota bacterium]
DASVGDDAVTIGVPGSLTFSTPFAMQATAQQDGHVTFSRRGDNSLLSLSFAGTHEALAYNDPQNGGESDTYDARSQVSLRDVIGRGASTLVTGIDLSRESALINAPPLMTAALAQSAVYAQYRTTIANTAVLSFGLRGEHDAPQGSVLEPSFGTLFTLGNARLSANYAGTFRVATIDELYFPGFSNPSLVPERSKNIDATLTLPLGGASLSAGWFDRQATNLIALDQNFIPQNIAQASLAGFIVSGHTAPLNGVVATVGVTDMYRAVNLTPGQTAARLDFEPVMTTILGVEHAFARTGVAFGVNANVRSPHVEEGVFRDGDTTIDAYVRGRIWSNAIASVRVYNLGNERYAPIFGYPAAGRTVEFELSTR